MCTIGYLAHVGGDHKAQAGQGQKIFVGTQEGIQGRRQGQGQVLREGGASYARCRLVVTNLTNHVNFVSSQLHVESAHTSRCVELVCMRWGDV